MERRQMISDYTDIYQALSKLQCQSLTDFVLYLRDRIDRRQVTINKYIKENNIPLAKALEKEQIAWRLSADLLELAYLSTTDIPTPEKHTWWLTVSQVADTLGLPSVTVARVVDLHHAMSNKDANK